MTTRTPVPTKPSLRERLRRLPKTELHLHALGSLRPATVVELARAKNAPILEAAEKGVARGYRFENLSTFVDFFIGLFGLVTTPAEFERVTFEILEDAALLGVRYIEPRWGPTSHLSRGATVDGMWAGLEAGRRAAERAHGIVARWIVDFPRSLPVAVADESEGIARATMNRRTVGFDIAGDERAVAADPKFAPVFRRARHDGLACVAHAGEAAGPESVVGALDLYGATRIGHGTRSVEDAALLARLVREGIPLEVCPTSNVKLNVVPSIASHPIRRFLAAGVPVTISSDDPALFSTDILTEYELLHREAGISLGTLARCAAQSFDMALLSKGERRERFTDTKREALAWAEATT